MRSIAYFWIENGACRRHQGCQFKKRRLRNIAVLFAALGQAICLNRALTYIVPGRDDGGRFAPSAVPLAGSNAGTPVVEPRAERGGAITRCAQNGPDNTSVLGPQRFVSRLHLSEISMSRGLSQIALGGSLLSGKTSG